MGCSRNCSPLFCCLWRKAGGGPGTGDQGPGNRNQEPGTETAGADEDEGEDEDGATDQQRPDPALSFPLAGSCRRASKNSFQEAGTLSPEQPGCGLFLGAWASTVIIRYCGTCTNPLSTVFDSLLPHLQVCVVVDCHHGAVQSTEVLETLVSHHLPLGAGYFQRLSLASHCPPPSPKHILPHLHSSQPRLAHPPLRTHIDSTAIPSDSRAGLAGHWHHPQLLNPRGLPHSTQLNSTQLD